MNALTELASSPLTSITVTVTAYVVTHRLWLALGKPSIAQPVLLTIFIVGAWLWAVDVDYDTYLTGGNLISFLLGPATVALAIPLYRHRALVSRAAPMVVTALVAGTTSAAASAVVLTRALGGTPEVVLSMAPKSATTPVALAIAQALGGVPSLAAVFAVTAGISGAVAGPALLTLVGVRDRRARGVAVGVASHGIGTARVLADDEMSGAFSGLAMGASALLTSLIVPLVIALSGT